MTAMELKIEMLNKALKIMVGHQSDIVYDFEFIERMEDGESDYWVVSPNGTRFTPDFPMLNDEVVIFKIYFKDGTYSLTQF